MFFALLLFGLVLAAGSLHRTGLLGIFALTALSVLWLLVNKGVEHVSLFTLSSGHGVTPLDAAGLAGLVLVVVQMTRLALGRGARERSTATGPATTSGRPDPD